VEVKSLAYIQNRELRLLQDSRVTEVWRCYRSTAIAPEYLLKYRITHRKELSRNPVTENPTIRTWSDKVTIINRHLKIFVALQDLTVIEFESADRILAASPKLTTGLSSNRKAIDNSLSPAILLASEKRCLKYPIQKHPLELREVPWTT
jgi:hypothetical protein